MLGPTLSHLQTGMLLVGPDLTSTRNVKECSPPLRPSLNTLDGPRPSLLRSVDSLRGFRDSFLGIALFHITSQRGNIPITTTIVNSPWTVHDQATYGLTISFRDSTQRRDRNSIPSYGTQKPLFEPYRAKVGPDSAYFGNFLKLLQIVGFDTLIFNIVQASLVQTTNQRTKNNNKWHWEPSDIVPGKVYTMNIFNLVAEEFKDVWSCEHKKLKKKGNLTTYENEYFQIGVDILQKGFERISITEEASNGKHKKTIMLVQAIIELKSYKIQIS
ncbi:unnamed protein product [Lupinus luteus]|uniref:Uncharacterized protein n=1 Tax=Lupinus luteus TaxID=3873 RepID=A0AAV1Y3F2_LUPLU